MGTTYSLSPELGALPSADVARVVIFLPCLGAPHSLLDELGGEGVVKLAAELAGRVF